jgi:hypothetical protein
MAASSSSSSNRRGSQSADMDRSDDGEPGSSQSTSPTSTNIIRSEDIRTAKSHVDQLQVKLNAATMSDDPNASASVAKELTLANRRLRQMEASFVEQEKRREEVAKLKEGIQIGIMNTKVMNGEREKRQERHAG